MKKLKKILSDVLGVNPSKITDSTSPESVPSWDSFRGLMLVTELQTRYGVDFSIEDIISIRNVGDIKKSLEKYGVKIEEA